MCAFFHLQAIQVMNPHSTNLQRHYMQADRVLLAVLWGMFVYAVALALWFGNLGQALVIGGGTTLVLTLLGGLIPGERLLRCLVGVAFMVIAALPIKLAQSGSEC